MEMADAEPDMVIGCFGGGSNFAGIGFPFLRKNFAEGKKIRVIAVEPEGCPKLTRGEFQYDFGDVAGFTPLIPMYTLATRFPAVGHSRRGIALPRGRLDRQPADEGRADRGAVDCRRSRPSPQAFCSPRPKGHHPGSGVDARHRRDDPRSAESQGGRRVENHPVQPLGQRRDRPLRLRAVPGRGAAGLRRRATTRSAKDGQPVGASSSDGCAQTIRDRKAMPVGRASLFVFAPEVQNGARRPATVHRPQNPLLKRAAPNGAEDQAGIASLENPLLRRAATRATGRPCRPG